MGILGVPEGLQSRGYRLNIIHQVGCLHIHVSCVTNVTEQLVFIFV